MALQFQAETPMAMCAMNVGGNTHPFSMLSAGHIVLLVAMLPTVHARAQRVRLKDLYICPSMNLEGFHLHTALVAFAAFLPALLCCDVVRLSNICDHRGPMDSKYLPILRFVRIARELQLVIFLEVPLDPSSEDRLR